MMVRGHASVGWYSRNVQSVMHSKEMHPVGMATPPMDIHRIRVAEMQGSALHCFALIACAQHLCMNALLQHCMPSMIGRRYCICRMVTRYVRSGDAW